MFMLTTLSVDGMEQNSYVSAFAFFIRISGVVMLRVLCYLVDSPTIVRLSNAAIVQVDFVENTRLQSYLNHQLHAMVN